MRILAVDDDNSIRDLLLEALTIAGYSAVTMASSGDDALAQIERANEPFDCFLLDVQMPGMDGIELCTRIRALPQHLKTPILMLTAMGQKDYIDRAFLSGATDYVTKPFDFVELKARVQVAEKLQAEIKQTEAIMNRRDDRVSLLSASRPNFKTAVSIADVSGALNLSTLQNYVAQLAHIQHFMTGAFAVKVPQLRTIFHEVSPEEFSYLLGDMAEVLGDTLESANIFMSYVGNGVFLCVGRKRRVPPKGELSVALERAFNCPDLILTRPDWEPFEVLVSDVCAPTFFGWKGGLDILDKALEEIVEAERGYLDARPAVKPKRVSVQTA